MKKTIFLIGSLFFSLLAVGQAPASNVVIATMPKGATKLQGQQLSKFVHDNYKGLGIPLDKENTYKVDGILISFWDLYVNPGFKKSLQASQAEMLGIRRLNKDTVNFSKIISVNNIHFLVYEYQKSNEVFLRFQSEFNKNNKNICGIVQFKKPDEVNAHKALDDFLSTVHFRE